MSYCEWIEYGYGIKTNNINTTPDKVLDLLSRTTNTREDFEEWVEEDNINTNNIKEILKYQGGPGGIHGIGAILSDVIYENEEIEFYNCFDYDGNEYLLYIPSYPWFLSEKEKNMRKEELEKILVKYISILTDEEIILDYYECHNGG